MDELLEIVSRYLSEVGSGGVSRGNEKETGFGRVKVVERELHRSVLPKIEKYSFWQIVRRRVKR